MSTSDPSHASESPSAVPDLSATSAAETFPPIILLAMEDITGMMDVAETLAGHVRQFETKLTEQTAKLETHIGKLEKEIIYLKKTPAVSL